MEPPLVERPVHHGHHGPVIVRERLRGDIEAVHTWMPYCWEGVSSGEDEGKVIWGLTYMGIRDTAPQGCDNKRERSK